MGMAGFGRAGREVGSRFGMDPRFWSRGTCIVGIFTVVAACTPAPDVKSLVPDAEKKGAYPDLVPAEQIIASKLPERISEQDDDIILSRIQALKSRAAWLRNQ